MRTRAKKAFFELTILNFCNMNTQELVIKTMNEAKKPLSAGEVASLAQLDRKEVDKAFAELKKQGAISSPVRCKWEPAK